MASDSHDFSVAYSATIHHWIHAEQTRWTLLYNYFMGSSILVLAWGSIFAASAMKYRLLLLIALASCGLVISAIWIVLVHRANGFVHEYSLLGERLEQSLAQESTSEATANYPFNSAKNHRATLGGVARIFSSRLSIILVPSMFAFLFAIFLFVAIRGLTLLQHPADSIQDTVKIMVRRGGESIAFYAFIFAALYALVDSILNVFDWFCTPKWLRATLKAVVFLVLFLLIMSNAWVHNMLSQLLGWLEVER
jgi:hypothetical protein